MTRKDLTQNYMSLTRVELLQLQYERYLLEGCCKMYAPLQKSSTVMFLLY
jgi:hypothetical protein